jgi:hypothetical protein
MLDPIRFHGEFKVGLVPETAPTATLGTGQRPQAGQKFFK